MNELGISSRDSLYCRHDTFPLPLPSPSFSSSASNHIHEFSMFFLTHQDIVCISSSSLFSLIPRAEDGGRGSGSEWRTKLLSHRPLILAMVAAAAGSLCPLPPSCHLAAVSIGGRFTLDAPSILRSVTREFSSPVQPRSSSTSSLLLNHISVVYS